MNELRESTAYFLTENLKMIERYDSIDWVKVNKAEACAIEFRTLVENFQETIMTAFKKWRQENADLQFKYEHTSMWIKAFNEIHSKLKEEFGV